jgi:hypothetical protein
MDCHPSKLYQAVEEFARIEDSLPGPSLDWDSEFFDSRYLQYLHLKNYKCDYEDYQQDKLVVEPQLLDHIQNVANVVVSTLGHFDPLYYDPKHGPGVVSDLTRDEFKFSFPSWNKRLEGVFPYADLAFANYSLWIDEASTGDWGDSSPFSKLIAVPKTQKTPRLIAAEPTAHQYCQQAMWLFFRERCNSTFLCNMVKFNDQGYSRDAAMTSSVDGKLATIDLSSASDRLTCRLVERLFSSNYSILAALRASRTPLLVQRLDKKVKSEFHLKKFATQGSACTFPVESICFMILALACTTYVRNIGRDPRSILRELKEFSCQGQVRIFGDDIIVPSDTVKCLYNVLGYFDLKVNEEKSFGTGNFRESCGLDAYMGVDITPAYYVRCCNPRKPETVISNVETSNNFYLKGLWVTANWIKETVGDRMIAVVSASSGLFGYKSFQGFHFTKLKWNDDYQKLTFLTRQLRAGKSREKVEHHGALLQYFLEKPDQDVTWSSGRQLRPKLKLVLGRVTVEQLFNC